MKSILFIVPYPAEGASNRFRVLQYLPLLEAEGFRTLVRPFYSQALWTILYRKGFFFRKILYGSLCAANRLLDLWARIDLRYGIHPSRKLPAGTGLVRANAASVGQALCLRF